MSGTNIWIIIAGNVINDEAKITGITPAIASFNGICVFCAPTIFLPTTLFEYCTGILLSACCTNTTPATKIIAPITIPIASNNPVVLNIPLATIRFHSVTTPPGNPEIIPTKINSEIPFPTPLFVIWSPSHINIDVPVTKPTTTKAPVKNELSTNIPLDWYAKYIPIDSTKASIIVKIFVYLLIFFLPSSPPSLVNLSNEGIIIASNCITIEAVIYGLIDIAKTENLEKAPPEIISINPAIPCVLLIASFNAILSTPGTVI